LEMQQDGVGGVDGLDWANSVAISPDGSHVYATSPNDDAVAVFGRDDISGELTFVEVQRDDAGGLDGLDGAKSVAVSPDGSHVYVAGSDDNAVAVFSRSVSDGKLTFVEVQRSGVGGVTGLIDARSVVVSPDGNHVYVASWGSDAVVVFGRDDTSGALTFVERQRDGLDGVDGLNGARSVAVSPDGNHVYAAGWEDDAVAVFSRDTVNGTLTFVEREKDGEGDVDGLDGASSVAISPDGSHVYATGHWDGGVVIFSRDDASGALTFVDWKISSYEGSRSVAVSPDGRHVYVACSDDDAVVVYTRNASDGKLTFREVQRDGVDGVDGLDLAQSVAVSPDGRYVYVAGLGDDAVAVFSRNASDGRLTFVEVQRDGVGGVGGLDGAEWVAISPDGDHVYATGRHDDAVAAFGVSARNVYLPLILRN